MENIDAENKNPINESNLIHINPDQEQLDKWTSGQHEKLRYEYDLNSNSVCIDLGAFHCEWALSISEKYNSPTIHAFEAVPSIFEIGQQNIINNPNIKLYNYGVGGSNYQATINIGPALGVSTSLFIESENKMEVNIRSIKEVFQDLNILNVDLMKINIEGSEYEVLECLIDNNLHLNIKNIQVQFHRLGDNYLERYKKIQENLSKTHKLTYEFAFIWENWELI
jgi:FkbM family methyltransferase